MRSGPIGGTSIAGPSDRSFFAAISLAIALLVFVGFARTFYLREWFDVPALGPFLSFHGSLMSGWILLLLVQANLIKINRIRWHRRLGILGACYAALIVPVGCMATLSAAAREVRAHSIDVPSQLNVLALELTQMLLFACLIGAAVVLRHRYDWHKRLMLLATLCILPNVIVRISLWSANALLQRNIVLLSMWALLVLAVAGLDSYRLRRIHPVFGFVGTGVLGSMYAAYFAGLTPAWMHFASRLVS